MAIRNRCPHMGAPLCKGTIRRRETGTPGSYGSRPIAACSTVRGTAGSSTWTAVRCPEDDRMRVAVYPVRVEDGRVLVEA